MTKQIDTQEIKEANLKLIGSMINEAASKGTKFISLPEMVNYVKKRKIIRYLITWLEHNEKIPRDEEHIYNTSLVFNPRGELVAKYRKFHLYDTDSFNESETVKSGSQVVNFETKFGNMGLAICYDIRFPRIYRLTSVRGAKLIFNTGKDHWEVLLCARAIENTCYIVAPAQISKKRKMQSYVRSS